MPPQRDVWAAIPAAQPESFDTFYRRVRPEVVRTLVMAVGSESIGREAADEALTRAFERWTEVSGYGNPEGWVYRVGLNWARSGFRRRRDVPTDRPPDRPHRDPIPHPELEPALLRLPLRQRAVVVLRYYNDWSLDDIARALGIPIGTVKSRLNRALTSLERQVGR